LKKEDTIVYSLGECKYESPLDIPQFIGIEDRVIFDVDYAKIANAFNENKEALSFENAGPRKKIFFNPSEARAAIVTCGGLCPGINNVIKSLVCHLYNQYGVKEILAVHFGYEGLIESYGHTMTQLTPEIVEGINETGGSIIASSRGKQDIRKMVDTLAANKIDLLFTIGGDGTLRGANEIFKEINRRGLKISVAGIPKTIDNDINYIDKTFGFSTAVSHARTAVRAAYIEASGARNGIGLVKVMGRDSGFIAAYTALASSETDYVFVPEVKFKLEGHSGFFAHLYKRLVEKQHAVVLVSEGAGQEHFIGDKAYDASGNVKYGDIGLLLKEKISEYFKAIKYHINLKYIDPSYMIRSMPASADDSVFCIMLAQNAVHGAMSGKSGFVVGRWNNYFTFLPIETAIRQRKTIDPKGYLWSIVKESTGQPDFS
jgi:6-phosphofructokinase 1